MWTRSWKLLKKPAAFLEQINMDELYQQHILDHAGNPRFKGVLSLCDAEGRAENPSCGDWGVMYLKEENGHVVAGFDGGGCAISQAGLSLLTESIQGKTLNELRLLTPGDIYTMLGIEISPARVNCALLGYKALETALKHLKHE